MIIPSDATPVACAVPGGVYDVTDSPLGPLFIGASASGLHRIDFLREGVDLDRCVALLERDVHDVGTRVDAASEAAAAESVQEAAQQLRVYWRGERVRFDLPLAPRGTAFQLRVWDALRGIPPGATLTYGAVARHIERPTASRAVGAAIGRNPLAVVVPCHRVVGSNGTLTGYAGGLDRKRRLLDLESASQAVPAAAAAAR